MPAISEHAELLGYLRSKAGKDLLAALPLVSSSIETTPVLEILRSSLAANASGLKKAIQRPVCVIAFGSLGRREYVSGVSDLDPLIVIEGKVTPALAAKARSAVLEPLAKTSPWLPLDHRQHLVGGNWNEIEKPDIPYPVVGTDDVLSASPTPLINQRQWQILLEGRPLFNTAMFDRLYGELLPQVEYNRGLRIDFQQLTARAVTLFANFDNPVFLYKSPFKYFKTRFLRDFFVFSTQLLFLLGHYQQRAGERLHPKYIRAATVNKMMRCVDFARRLDEACSDNESLSEVFESEIANVLKAHDLHRPPILQFGSEQYNTKPGRYLHGLLMSVLSRFSACWEQIYDPHVRNVLASLPRDIAVDGVFPPQVSDPQAIAVLTELRERRNAYRKYMSATASVIRDVFPRGRVWAMATVPPWISDSLVPFIRVPGAG